MSVYASSSTTLPPRSVKAITASLILYAGALGAVALYWRHWDDIYKRNQDSLSRRATQALEMKLVQTRLDRFHARLGDGEVLDEADVEEVKGMEAVLRRWFRCVEEDVAREDRDKARGRERRGRGGFIAWLPEW